ncbi:MAG: PQQ-binding-like beta-propeller repeat protein [Rubrivivax sp.]|nr:PQQ-binding-like beta-propeller repeat protein [Rubrivivax sp.]
MRTAPHLARLIVHRVIAASVVCAPTATLAAGDGGWPVFGGNLQNTHHASTEAKISPARVSRLRVKWVYQTTPDQPGAGVLPNTTGDVGVPPAIKDGVLYFPDWAGYLHAVRATDGSLVWKRFLPLDYSRPGKFMMLSRNTPAIAGDRLIIGSEKHFSLATCPQGAPACIPNTGAVVAAIDRQTGNLLWSTRVDAHPAAKITSSPIVVGKQVIVGVSSWEEDLAITASAAQFGGSPNEPYPCCSFRGSVVSLDLMDGRLNWQTFTTPGTDVPAGLLAPGEVGYRGAVVYGSSPAVDFRRGQVYVATGNNYVVPKKAEQCERHRLDPTGFPAPELPAALTCENLNDRVGNHVDSMLALDLRSGRIRWAFRARAYDSWVHSCAIPDFYLAGFPPVLGFGAPEGNLASCPSLPGPDFGFGQAPMLIENVAMPDGRRRDLVGAGEKSGIFWALDPDTGGLVWSTKVGPGGILGGMQWGSATDGRLIYTANSNANNANRDRALPFYGNPLDPIYPGFPGFLNAQTQPSGPGFDGGAWTLINPPADTVPDNISTFVDGSRLKTITGFWSALDAATGRIVWQRPVPTEGRPPISSPLQTVPPAGALHGSVTLANGVLFGGAADGLGSMYAMEASSGRILFRHRAQFEGRDGGSIEASPAVVDGVVYWGTGASRGGIFSTPFLQAVTGVPFTFGGTELRNNKLYAFELAP